MSKAEQAETLKNEVIRPRHRWTVVLLIVLVGVVSSTYLVTAFTTADGRPVAPLDDAYITYQYARQIARGYPYQYNDGDPPTTGMTSPLFGFLLAGAYLLGFTGERLVAFSVGMGVIWLGLATWLTYRLASRLMGYGSSGRIWALAAAALVILTGSVQWGCFNGMETGLFTALTLAVLDAFLAERTGLCVLWLSLAGLTRPEGLILAGLIWAAILAKGILHSCAIHWNRLGLLSAAVAVALVPLLVNWMLTGTTAATGLQAKSRWFNVPRYPWDIVRSILRSCWRSILPRFLGWESPARWLAPPGLFLFSLLGWVSLEARRRWTTLSVTLLWLLLGTLSTATLITATWHLSRYQVPFVPLVIALAVCGLAFLQRRAMRRWQQASLGLLVLFLLASSAYSTLRFGRSYRQAISTMVNQQLVIADWLPENLPADARVGVHDTGSLRYLGGRPTYDLIGLTTADAAIAWRHGAGSVLERMEHSPMRPDYFAIYPDIFFIPYLAATDLFAEELFRVEVPDYSGVTSASGIQGVWRADWRLADSGEQFYQPDVLELTADLKLVDRLDVADLDDEAAHGMKWWHDLPYPGWPTEAHQLTYRALPEQEVLDGGRLLTGGISFEAATRPGEPLRIVARLHAQEAGVVQVEVNGRDVRRWAYPAVPGQWLETAFWVPAETITDSRTRFVLRVDASNPDFRHYAPYHFWFLQGEVEIERRVEVTFDGGFHLLGFDLPGQVWHPGDAVPVTLYWQATVPTQSDAKVFLHLYDADGNLGPQSDGWAFHGTRPPYTWSPGEIVMDPRPLALPTTLQPGQYSLEVGLYKPDGLTRLPACRDGVRQQEDRVPLTVIEVRE
jgi:MFS family permease